MSHNKYIRWRKQLPLLFFVFFLITSCNKNDDDPFKLPWETLRVNEFIWENMDKYYLWRAYMPTNIDLKKEEDSKAYFDKLLYKPEDRWSFISDDYQGLIEKFQGIDVTFGHHFQVFRVPGSDDVVGIVQFVTDNSPAQLAGIQRGDLFYKVDGKTLNTTNFKELLFSRTSYTLSFGRYENGGIVDAGREIALLAIKMQENPIVAKTVLTIEGQKIGYLAYTQFIDDFTDSLEYALNDFQIAGISDLILDLRYNPGGVITNARDLSSMIGPWQEVNDNSIFAKLIWNDLLTDYYIEKEGVNSVNLVLRFKAKGINLDLHRIYVLISSNTASASELIVNCLKPYMEVILIGPESTHGKYTASITLSDLNKHNWAIQPIVLKTANADGITDYRDGFAPDYVVRDNLFMALGDPEEDMLAKAIELITGITTITRKSMGPEDDFAGIPILSGSNRPLSESQKMIWDFTFRTTEYQ